MTESFNADTMGDLSGSPHERTILMSLITALAWYGLTSSVVLAGAWWGVDFLERRRDFFVPEAGFWAALGSRDGLSYALIAREGYTYDHQHYSSVAYFPAYPLLGRAVARVTQLSEETALLIVAQGCLLGVFVLLAAYVQSREGQFERSDWTLLAFGLWPTTMFFRMAYSESLFVMVVLAAMYGMARRWPLGVIALLVGLATACRPVGVALWAPFGYHLWSLRKSMFGFAWRAAFLAPVAAWGLLAYMAYLHFAFDDALAFVKAQDHFAGQVISQREQILAALSLEPLWSKYDPASPAYWARGEAVGNPLFSLEFANPIYFTVTAGLVVFGAWKGWLDEREWLLAVGLLMIPYLSHAHRAGMLSQGRYAASVFPVYLVLGRLLAMMPPPLAAALSGWMAFLLGAYSALFAASYRII